MLRLALCLSLQKSAETTSHADRRIEIAGRSGFGIGERHLLETVQAGRARSIQPMQFQTTSLRNSIDMEPSAGKSWRTFPRSTPERERNLRPNEPRSTGITVGCTVPSSLGTWL